MATLYYDSVSRIVPSGVVPDDRHFYQEFSDEPDELLNDIRELTVAGFLGEEPPDERISEVANDFFDFAMENLVDPVRRSEMVPRLSGRGGYYTIHPEKITPELLQVLSELKLAHEKQGDPYSDWSVEPVTGGLYMLFLATRMAGQRQLVSDSSVYQSLLYTPIGTRGDRITPDDRQFRLATAVLTTVIPSDLEDMDLDVLLRLRQDFSSQRQRFQDKIADFARDLQNFSGGDLEAVVDRHSRAIHGDYEDWIDRLRTANLTLAQGLFSVSVPSYLTSPWGLGTSTHPVIFAAGAVAVSAVAMKYVLERRAASRSPFTYLLNVSRRLGAERMAENIIRLNLSVPEDDDDDDRRMIFCA
jgi:hypothetical protein